MLERRQQLIVSWIPFRDGRVILSCEDRTGVSCIGTATIDELVTMETLMGCLWAAASAGGIFAWAAS